MNIAASLPRGRTVGLWMYENGGGREIQQQMVDKLAARGISTVVGLDLAHAISLGGETRCNGVVMEELDLFFSYNAGQQRPYQVYLYEALSRHIPTINNFEAFRVTEDKFLTANKLNRAGVRTTEHFLCCKENLSQAYQVVKNWGGRAVYKPVGGWGGMGIVKIENECALDMLASLVDQLPSPEIYLERFVNYDRTDYRVDVVDGECMGIYGRKAGNGDWRTNVSAGGSVILRAPNDEITELAQRAALATSLEIAGVDILYDLDREEYIVLEVNGIPAFATPEQERFGLDFNQRKIHKIVELITRTIEEKDYAQHPHDKVA